MRSRACLESVEECANLRSVKLLLESVNDWPVVYRIQVIIPCTKNLKRQVSCLFINHRHIRIHICTRALIHGHIRAFAPGAARARELELAAVLARSLACSFARSLARLLARLLARSLACSLARSRSSGGSRSRARARGRSRSLAWGNAPVASL